MELSLPTFSKISISMHFRDYLGLIAACENKRDIIFDNSYFLSSIRSYLLRLVQLPYEVSLTASPLAFVTQ